jgi:branched-chain amino acid aminotransferase
MPDSLVWIDGIQAQPGVMHLSALDRGFTLADGLFETMRISNGVVFRPGSHLGRLHASARRMGLPLPTNLPRVIEDAVRTAADKGILDGRLRLTISRGVGEPGLAPSTHGNSTCVITIAERSVMPDDPRPGLDARTASGRRNEHSMTAGMKTLAYTDSVLALAEARAAGADEAVMLDTGGHLSEGSASNVFLMLGEVLHTPPLSCAALPGITRTIVIEIADKLGIAVDERPLLPADMRGATEAFLTSSVRGIAPLRSVDGHVIGTSCPGRATTSITERYHALIAMECTAWPSAAP